MRPNIILIMSDDMGWSDNRAIRAGDQTETKNLAAVRPELTEKLAARWREWTDITEVKYSDD